MPALVHLGMGNFHRAHQAWYTHLANGAAVTPWRITGVAMRNPDVRDAMARAGWEYDLGIMGPEGLRVERIGVHDRVLVAAEDPRAVIDAIADPDVSAITLTVTEKGYCLTPGGALDTRDPGIASDISSGTTRTVIGLLAAGLTRRVERGVGSVTILSCDNLGGNGDRLRAGLEAFFDASGTGRAPLALAHFPNTMVDRITPATSDEIAARIADAAGRPVVAPVLTEAFSEWVIEETGRAGLPDWTRGGAELVADVAPYENRKLLMLNAAHSALAYGGLSGGLRFVHEAVADPDLARHVRALWGEAAPLLPTFDGAELERYASSLMARFAVAGMAHRLSQIATDGTAKLPQRILPILRHHRFQAPAAARVLGDWWRVIRLRTERGDPLDDPSEAALQKAVHADGDSEHASCRRSPASACRRTIFPAASQGCASIPGRNHRIAFPMKPDKNGRDGKNP
jgi:fructuronate reductase